MTSSFDWRKVERRAKARPLSQRRPVKSSDAEALYIRLKLTRLKQDFLKREHNRSNLL